MKRHLPFALALLLELAGAAGALLSSLPTWQTITVPRAGLAAVHVDMTGRDVDPASTALALVALAGVVAVLATRGVWRRVVGGVVAVAGLGLIWRGAVSAGAVSEGRARSFVESHRKTFTVDPGVVPQVGTHPVWAVLTVLCGVLVLAAGALVAARSGHWQTMSARYERPSDEPREGDDARAAASLWTALDRGEDPTSR